MYCWVVESNCHCLELFLSANGKRKGDNIPAAARFYCIPCVRDLAMMLFVFGLCRLLQIFAFFLVVSPRKILSHDACASSRASAGC
jgi:hypothetical protein